MRHFDSDTILHINYGSYFGGVCRITLSKRDNKVACCSIRGFNGWKMGKDEEFTFPAEECKKIQEMVSPIKDWKEKYEPKYDITDGFGWTIYANFDEKNRKKWIYGVSG